MTRRTTGFVCATALAVLLCAESLAQLGGGFPGGGRGGSRGQGGPPRDQRPQQEKPGAARQDSATPVFSILKALEEDLRLTPEQQPAWQSYSAKVTALADDISRERSRSQAAAPAKALQRIDQSVDLVRNRLAALEDIAEAARKLYAGFTPQQQGIADPRLASIVEEIAYEASAFTALERRAR